MAARNKRPSRAATGDAGPRTLDAQQIFGTRSRASQHREDLLEEARTLRAAGKIREARGVEKRAGQVEQLLSALEGEMARPSDSLAEH